MKAKSFTIKQASMKRAKGRGGKINWREAESELIIEPEHESLSVFLQLSAHQHGAVVFSLQRSLHRVAASPEILSMGFEVGGGGGGEKTRTAFVFASKSISVTQPDSLASCVDCHYHYCYYY
jgi:hypothetical protein